METLEKIDVVVVDKTGTLTEGKPRLVKIVTAQGLEENELLRIVASLEQRSEHPLAAAIVQGARERNLTIADPELFESITGGGVVGRVQNRHAIIGTPRLLESRDIAGLESLKGEAEKLQDDGATVIFAAIDGKTVGILAITDPIRQSTPEAIAELHRLGLKIVILTGDNPATAQAVAKKMNIDEVQAEVAPQDKYREIQKLRGAGHIVAMAGDGINDAPALAAADVGIAMGNRHGRRYRERWNNSHERRSAGNRQSDPLKSSGNAQHPAKSLLCLHLQCARRANCGGRSLSIHRHSPEPHDRQCRHEPQLGFRYRQRPASPEGRILTQRLMPGDNRLLT